MCMCVYLPPSLTRPPARSLALSLSLFLYFYTHAVTCVLV